MDLWPCLVYHAIHFLPRKIQKRCTVKLFQVRDGTEGQIITFEEMAAVSPDDNIRRQAERRKGQMKHDEAIKGTERMSVRFITCILIIKNKS